MPSPKQRKPAYPWAELYNLESRTGTYAARRQLRAGRPPRPVHRVKVTLELTDEERRILKEIQAALATRLSSVAQGQVVGLALRRLKAELSGDSEVIVLPQQITDWSGVVEYLEQGH